MAVETPLLSAAEICITVAGDDAVRVVQNAGLQLRRGGSLGIAGESGSGKTALVHALLGYAREGLEFADGRIAIWTRDAVVDLQLTKDDFRVVRGSRLALVPQAASSVLDPIMTVGHQLHEVAAAVIGPDSADDRVLATLAEVGFEHPEEIIKRYAHQLSGGQRQRINLCLALLGRPEILILDEATTDLDAITQRRVLEMIKRLKVDHDLTLVAVSHDLRVLAEICEDLIIMRDGHIVEHGDLRELLDAPKHDYTASLVQRFRVGPLAGVEPTDHRTVAGETSPILEVHHMRATHRTQRGGRTRTVEVLHEVSLEALRGESIGIVGESGSGKTTFARSLLGIHPNWSGDVRFNGAPLVGTARRRPLQVRKSLQIVLQNPDTTFNPRLTIGQSIAHRLQNFEGLSRGELRPRIRQLLNEVGLQETHADRYSAELSGGQRQRASIARSLVGDPDLLVCDEVVSGLDVESQARVIQLLSRLRSERGLTLLFISHDISVVAALTQRIAVFHQGSIVEWGPTEQVIENPASAYTRELVNAAYISVSKK
ncbi:peptide ABC transporter ATP-binding protein [Sphaerisporangium krabiense]|uniref:Peptide/nickel transport system ATP-binding protein n=1 Tax=Sphaerisporangium krabiense TaxID=763782 RepID=A0A7W9DNA0_9ACTN|nr:ABC transporter ATP-binding protein [Sphaerisporangium krabiense]MBB5625133.1 peptide/nickel transport system ATP-binding protein [Sphaerisporangium krabiense]GII67517.1 peptide ABC transporter ATP-binding protein [Sphaerisporangium krabiense]